MTYEEICKTVDHTLLLQTATWEDIKVICDDAVHYHCASIMIPPCYVKRAAEYVKGACPIGTVIGFPNGSNTTATKVFEAKEAIANGASEVDMVINIGDLKAKNYDAVEAEIRALKEAAGDHVLKVIIETCLLTDEEKIKMCEICAEAGADFIKTSTGFSTGGATFEDIKLMKEHATGTLQVKASGGISSLEDAEKFLALGAARLGTSRIVKIIKSKEQ